MRGKSGRKEKREKKEGIGWKKVGKEKKMREGGKGKEKKGIFKWNKNSNSFPFFVLAEGGLYPLDSAVGGKK